MTLLFEDKGRGYFGKSFGNTFIKLRLPFIGWYWYQSKIYLYEDKIRLEVWPRKFIIPLNQIISIDVKKYYALFGELKITHMIKNYPRCFMFYCWNQEMLLKHLKTLGVNIIEIKRTSP